MINYNDYEEIAKDVTAENALDVITTMLAKAKEDSVASEAEVTDLKDQLKKSKDKYDELRVDYIDKFIGNSAQAEDLHDEEAEREAENNRIREIIAGNVN